MTYITKKDIEYDMYYKKIKIPKGTKVVPATNLPEDSQIKYWSENWKNMTDEEKSWARNYGFGVEKDDVIKKHLSKKR